MITICRRILSVLTVLYIAQTTVMCFAKQGDPLSLHPDNPHYFVFRERPTVLITSGEHYGAVLNLDFDYKTYLETLKNEGLNHTRTWVGTKTGAVHRREQFGHAGGRRTLTSPVFDVDISARVSKLRGKN